MSQSLEKDLLPALRLHQYFHQHPLLLFHHFGCHSEPASPGAGTAAAAALINHREADLRRGTTNSDTIWRTSKLCRSRGVIQNLISHKITLEST